jgi:hypothetical protein
MRNFLLLDVDRGGYGHRSPLIGKTCYQLGSNIFFPYIWMQISRVLLVYDVKISQLGRKNLAVRFDTYQIGGGNERRPWRCRCR